MDIQGIIVIIAGLVDRVTPVLVALALLFFFWGVAKYILAAGDEEAKAAGRSIMIWGIIALFVIVSVWGLVRVLQQTFLGGVPEAGSGDIPGVDVLR